MKKHEGRGVRPVNILFDALRAALALRLLVLWTVGSILPTAVAAIPLWRLLARALDHSPRAADFAERADALVFEDLVVAFARSAAPVGGATLVATIVAALSWPFWAGVALGAERAEGPLGFTSLLLRGVTWYGRMFRIWLVSLLPVSLIGAVAALAWKAAAKHEHQAILESQARLGWRVALVVTLLFFVLLHATVEAGRAELGADESLHSGWRAWIRGVRLMMSRPFPVLGLYLGATAASFAVAAFFLVLRLRVIGASGASFLLGFVLTQLAVAAIGWGRASRLFALAALARARNHAPSVVSSAQRA